MTARYVNVALRTVHLAAFGLLLGGHAWNVPPERLAGALAATVASGVGLALLECREGFGWLLEGRGLMFLAKLGVLLAVPFAWEHRFGILMAVVVVASVGSHLPRTVRHASLASLLAEIRARLTRRNFMRDIARLTGILAAVITLALAAPLAGAEPLAPLPALKAPKAEQAELGKLLFFDTRLSGDAAIACATCHDPKKGWGDGKPLSTGYPGSEYFRNTQTLLNAAYYGRNYWDGRMDGRDLPTLVRDHLTEAHFMQVDGRLFAERLKQAPAYDEMFRKVMGGEPSFGRTLNALTAFLQTLTSRNAPFDRYLEGETSALSATAREGMKLFQGKARCVQCHDGALLSDQKFHALGVPENRAVYGEPLRHVTFRRFMKTLGVDNYDNLREDVGLYGVTKEAGDRGRFRTPSLREVARTAPYMHNGVFATLDEVVEFYNRGGGSHPNKGPLLEPLGLSEGEKKALVEFLESLGGDPVVVERPALPEYKLRQLGKN